MESQTGGGADYNECRQRKGRCLAGLASKAFRSGFRDGCGAFRRRSEASGAVPNITFGKERPGAVLCWYQWL